MSKAKNDADKYSCDLCSKEYKYLAILKRHMAQKHKLDMFGNSLSPQEVLDICGVSGKKKKKVNLVTAPTVDIFPVHKKNELPVRTPSEESSEQPTDLIVLDAEESDVEPDSDRENPIEISDHGSDEWEIEITEEDKKLEEKEAKQSKSAVEPVEGRSRAAPRKPVNPVGITRIQLGDYGRRILAQGFQASAEHGRRRRKLLTRDAMICLLLSHQNQPVSELALELANRYEWTPTERHQHQVRLNDIRTGMMAQQRIIRERIPPTQNEETIATFLNFIEEESVRHRSLPIDIDDE